MTNRPPIAKTTSARISDLRGQAEALGQSLPALLAQADVLAANVMLGEHGRRRAGQGDEFWQYRLAGIGDPARSIDWRRSGKSDQQFVREREWQAAQTVTLWLDQSQSMGFSGDKSRATKGDCAMLVGLALAVLLLRGGERVGLSGAVAPRPGRAHLLTIAAALAARARKQGDDHSTDYGTPDVSETVSQGRVVFVSDFLGPLDAIDRAIAIASGRGIKGLVLQILDPLEEEFPFDGRTVFQSMGGALRHETMDASSLRDRYLERLASRKDHLATLADQMGWHYHCHHTGKSAQSALLWAYMALKGGN